MLLYKFIYLFYFQIITIQVFAYTRLQWNVDTFRQLFQD